MQFGKPRGCADSGTDVGAGTHRRVLLLVGVVTTITLVLTVQAQIYDSNFYLLWEATALLAGDHPYRDFYEWGAPLAAYLSAGMQLLVGYRLIGEFLAQWLFIVAGLVIAFHLGLRLSRSVAATLVTFAVVLPIVSQTPTYHYSKLLFFPVTVWLAWRYLERPTPWRGASVGCTAAVAFLFRHDYGLYIGFASVVAFVFARIAVPASRRLTSVFKDAAAYVVAVVVVIAPWAAVVQATEGLVEYTRMRAAMFEEPEDSVVYSALLQLNPLRQLTFEPPTPSAGVVAFFWQPDVDDTQQRQLERDHGLRRLEEPDDRNRPRYEVSNIYDPDLLMLDPYIADGSGFEWERLEEMRWRLPSRDNTALWLEQMALLLPIALLFSAGWMFLRNRHVSDSAGRLEASQLALAGAFLVVVDSALFRQPAYMVAVAPLTAALSARYLARKTVVVRGITIVLLVLTSFAAVVWSRDSLLFRPRGVGGAVSSAFRQLLASPPVEASSSGLLRYLHDCTAPGDRLLVMGSTPYQINYYAQRPPAGGHMFWREGWRSDPQHQQQLLELIGRQSVPFAFSTHEPVLDELGLYPGIQEYVASHYVEVEGFRGRLLVDTRRQAVRTFGPEGLPCFE